MDIQKEREKFEKFRFKENYDELKQYYDEYEKEYGDRYPSYTYEDEWEAWQAAKAQAVPESFVLVEKCDIEMMLQLIDNSLGYKSAPNKDDTMKIVKNMLIQITEAQEQSHD